jgi:hypothetical protein
MSEPPIIESAPETSGPWAIFSFVGQIETALARRLMPTLADSTRPWPELNLNSPHQPSASAYTFLGFDALRHYLRFVCQLQDNEPVRPPSAFEMLISPPLREAYRQFCQDFNLFEPAQSRTMLRFQTGVDRLLGWELDDELRATFRGRITPWFRLSRRRKTLKPYFLPKPGPTPDLDPSSPIQPKPETLARLCRASRVVYLGYVKELQERKGELWWEFPHACVSRLIPGFWAGFEAFHRDFWPQADEEDERLAHELEQLFKAKGTGNGSPSP